MLLGMMVANLYVTLLTPVRITDFLSLARQCIVDANQYSKNKALKMGYFEIVVITRKICISRGGGTIMLVLHKISDNMITIFITIILPEYLVII